MILILGAGFLGSAVYNDLASKGYRVKLFSRNENENGSKDFIKGEVTEIEKYAHILDGVTTVIHTIHTTVPATSFENEKYDVESNVISFIKLLKLCKNKNIKKFIYISSGGAVYGKSKTNIAVDESSPTNPISSYGITKLTNEKYLLMHQQLFSEGVIILRPSNIYGIGQKLSKLQGIIGYLMDAAQTGNSIEIWGDGTSSKDYLHISDFVIGLKKVIDSTEKFNQPVFNISSGKQFTLLEIINIIEKNTNKKINLQFSSQKTFDVKNSTIDNVLFSNTFKWQPKITFEIAIKDMLKALVKQ